MDYEKKYKDALKWIESIYPNLNHEHQMEAEVFFPELVESEDEKIRQELIKFLNDCYNIDSGFFSRYCKIPFKQMLSWVEKQNHWKPSDKQMEAVKKAFRELFNRDLVDGDFVSLFNDLDDLWRN